MGRSCAELSFVRGEAQCLVHLGGHGAQRLRAGLATPTATRGPLRFGHAQKRPHAIKIVALQADLGASLRKSSLNVGGAG